MTAPVLFLLGAIALALLGATIVWLLSLPRKARFGESIHLFRRDLDALAPPNEEAPRPRPGPRRASEIEHS